MEEWIADGHGQHCGYQPTLIHDDSGTQTNPPLSVNASTSTVDENNIIHMSQPQTDHRLPTSVTTNKNGTQTQNDVDVSPSQNVAVQTDGPFPRLTTTTSVQVDTSYTIRHVPTPLATSYDDTITSTPLATSQNQPKSPQERVFEPKQPISS
jgi:hypothetical protein